MVLEGPVVLPLPARRGLHPEPELPDETRTVAKKEGCVCCVCVQCVCLTPWGLALPRATQRLSPCVFRFGVIHSVFTNLLLWANSVLNESKHQLNEHKERLITLGFGNISIGEW